MKTNLPLKALLVIVAASVGVLASCADDKDGTSGVHDDAGASDTDVADADTDEDASAPRVGFEILQIVGPSEIVVWLGLDLTLEDFNALAVPQGWFKNQPRESEPDGASFARSPDATVDGEFTDAEHFGHMWRHNATVIEANTPLDDEGLLRLNRIAKLHEVRFNAGRTLFVLVSPEGERFVRISRDAGRTSEVPTLPSDWQLVEHVIAEELVFDLPNPTLNIRCDNEDSFQGPVTELEGL
jgi:hypothetical protein